MDPRRNPFPNGRLKRTPPPEFSLIKPQPSSDNQCGNHMNCNTDINPQRYETNNIQQNAYDEECQPPLSIPSGVTRPPPPGSLCKTIPRGSPGPSRQPLPDLPLHLKPYPFQKDIIEKSYKSNRIVFLETGQGKTLIATHVIHRVLKRDYNYVANNLKLIEQQQSQLSNIEQPKDRMLPRTWTRKAVFLVPTNALMDQQAKYLTKHLGQEVLKLNGEQLESHKIDIKENIENHNVIVATHGAFRLILEQKDIRFHDIAIIVYDECHNCTGNSEYVRISNQHYRQYRDALYEMICRFALLHLEFYCNVIKMYTTATNPSMYDQAIDPFTRDLVILEQNAIASHDRYNYATIACHFFDKSQDQFASNTNPTLGVLRLIPAQRYLELDEIENILTPPTTTSTRKNIQLPILPGRNLFEHFLIGLYLYTKCIQPNTNLTGQEISSANDLFDRFKDRITEWIYDVMPHILPRVLGLTASPVDLSLKKAKLVQKQKTNNTSPPVPVHGHHDEGLDDDSTSDDDNDGDFVTVDNTEIKRQLHDLQSNLDAILLVAQMSDLSGENRQYGSRAVEVVVPYIDFCAMSILYPPNLLEHDPKFNEYRFFPPSQEVDPQPTNKQKQNHGNSNDTLSTASSSTRTTTNDNNNNNNNTNNYIPYFGLPQVSPSLQGEHSIIQPVQYKRLTQVHPQLHKTQQLFRTLVLTIKSHMHEMRQYFFILTHVRAVLLFIHLCRENNNYNIDGNNNLKQLHQQFCDSLPFLFLHDAAFLALKFRYSFVPARNDVTDHQHRFPDDHEFDDLLKIQQSCCMSGHTLPNYIQTHNNNQPNLDLTYNVDESLQKQSFVKLQLFASYLNPLSIGNNDPPRYHQAAQLLNSQYPDSILPKIQNDVLQNNKSQKTLYSNNGTFRVIHDTIEQMLSVNAPNDPVLDVLSPLFRIDAYLKYFGYFETQFFDNLFQQWQSTHGDVQLFLNSVYKAIINPHNRIHHNNQHQQYQNQNENQNNIVFSNHEDQSYIKFPFVLPHLPQFPSGVIFVQKREEAGTLVAILKTLRCFKHITPQQPQQTSQCAFQTACSQLFEQLHHDCDLCLLTKLFKPSMFLGKSKKERWAEIQYMREFGPKVRSPNRQEDMTSVRAEELPWYFDTETYWIQQQHEDIPPLHTTFQGLIDTSKFTVKSATQVTTAQINGGLNLLIATTVIEEGIDISDLSVVIFYDHIEKMKPYIQRRGRARALTNARVFIFESAQLTLSRSTSINDLTSLPAYVTTNVNREHNVIIPYALPTPLLGDAIQSEQTGNDEIAAGNDILKQLAPQYIPGTTNLNNFPLYYQIQPRSPFFYQFPFQSKTTTKGLAPIIDYGRLHPQLSTSYCRYTVVIEESNLVMKLRKLHKFLRLTVKSIAEIGGGVATVDSFCLQATWDDKPKDELLYVESPVNPQDYMNGQVTQLFIDMMTKLRGKMFSKRNNNNKLTSPTQSKQHNQHQNLPIIETLHLQRSQSEQSPDNDGLSTPAAAIIQPSGNLEYNNNNNHNIMNDAISCDNTAILAEIPIELQQLQDELDDHPNKLGEFYEILTPSWDARQLVWFNDVPYVNEIQHQLLKLRPIPQDSREDFDKVMRIIDFLTPGRPNNNNQPTDPFLRRLQEMLFQMIGSEWGSTLRNDDILHPLRALCVKYNVKKPPGYHTIDEFYRDVETACVTKIRGGRVNKDVLDNIRFTLEQVKVKATPTKAPYLLYVGPHHPQIDLISAVTRLVSWYNQLCIHIAKLTTKITNVNPNRRIIDLINTICKPQQQPPYTISQTTQEEYLNSITQRIQHSTALIDEVIQQQNINSPAIHYFKFLIVLAIQAIPSGNAATQQPAHKIDIDTECERIINFEHVKPHNYIPPESHEPQRPHSQHLIYDLINMTPVQLNECPYLQIDWREFAMDVMATPSNIPNYSLYAKPFYFLVCTVMPILLDLPMFRDYNNVQQSQLYTQPLDPSVIELSSSPRPQLQRFSPIVAGFLEGSDKKTAKGIAAILTIRQLVARGLIPPTLKPFSDKDLAIFRK